MNNGFDPNNYKNLELFRYYLSRHLQKIDSSIQKKHGEILSYFIASLVDVFIVFVFSDRIKNVDVLLKLVCIVGLIIVFFIVSRVVDKVSLSLRVRRMESGREEYVVNSVRQEMIDEFDNIACGCLLICESYMKRYRRVSGRKQYLKEFYFFEIIHYLTKATNLFGEIYSQRDLYVSSNKEEMIDIYRVNNFIDFAEHLKEFLNNEKPKCVKDKGVEKDIANLNAEIDKWQRID